MSILRQKSWKADITTKDTTQPLRQCEPNLATNTQTAITSHSQAICFEAKSKREAAGMETSGGNAAARGGVAKHKDACRSADLSANLVS